MKLLFDYLPLLLFFIVYKIAGLHPAASYTLASSYLGPLVSGAGLERDQGPIMLATAVVIVATLLQVLYVKMRGQKVDAMLWASFAIITIMGGLTIYLHNENFIKWKPTILYWACALILGVAQMVFNKNLVRQGMEEQVKLPDEVWNRVGQAWVAFFTVLGALNLLAAYVIFRGNTDAWVSFKVFGITGLFFVFVVVQTLLLSRHILEEDA